MADGFIVRRTGGADTSDTTATVNDVVNTKKFYDSSGVLVSGNLDDCRGNAGAGLITNGYDSSSNELHLSLDDVPMAINGVTDLYVQGSDVANSIALTSDKLVRGNKVLGVNGSAVVGNAVGTKWSNLISSPFGADAITSAAVIDGVAFIAGSGYIARSTDDGVTWSNFYLSPSGYSINKIVATCGVVLAFGGTNMFKSLDLGVTWVEYPNIMPFVVNTVGAIDGVVIAGSSAGKIVRSSNYGQTWSDFINNPFGGAIIRAIINVDGVVLAVGNTGKISRSVDKGLTWSEAIANPFSGGTIFAAANVDGVVLVSVGAGVSRSTDKGLTWESIIESPFNYGTIFSIVNVHGVAIIAGIGGMISRSTDKGLTWSELITNAMWTTVTVIRDIVNVHGTAIAVGDSGKIIRTIN